MKRSLISLLSILPLSFAACGGDATTGDCTPGAGGSTAKFVADTVTVPTDRNSYTFDLTGSGKATNQLGVVMSALVQASLDPQMSVDMAIASGQLVLLLSENSADATFQTDTCASSSIANGMSGTAAPTAGATYTVDTTLPGGTFNGPITAGKFDSTSPATTKKPVTVQLQLPLVPMAAPLDLTVIGAHVQFTYAGGKITGGQINGAIKETDVQTSIIPSVVNLLQGKIIADAASPGGLTATDNQILSVFDGGGTPSTSPATGCSSQTCTASCQNPMSAKMNPCGCATSGDKMVDYCEVSTSTIITSVLAPDVQMFDASGNYAPNPNPTMKDSVSIGLAFTAISASF